MTRATHTHTHAAPVYLHINGTEEELDAVWLIDTETAPAEPYSHGGGRGYETENASARLVSWHRHGREYTRADAVALDAAAVARQERYLLETWEN
ncbi:hypothetical protein KLEP181_gp38 [Paracoccus phage vB_PmaP_KLEP18-1]|nr:hypothetical protein KLEP181_gp38 [Paracoccus phage vB_PmaP_KLEP18-1]